MSPGFCLMVGTILLRRMTFSVPFATLTLDLSQLRAFKQCWPHFRDLCGEICNFFPVVFLDTIYFVDVLDQGWNQITQYDIFNLILFFFPLREFYSSLISFLERVFRENFRRIFTSLRAKKRGILRISGLFEAMIKRVIFQLCFLSKKAHKERKSGEKNDYIASASSLK